MFVVILLKFMVDFFLLLGGGRLCGFPVKPTRAAMGAVLGGLYAGICLLPGFGFLGNLPWRLTSFGVISVLAYGLSAKTVTTGGVFAALNLSLNMAVIGIGKGGFTGIVCAIVLCLVCSFSFSWQLGRNLYVPVELSYGTKSISLTALQDTGNTLLDPITGQKVLVIGADAARELTGLSRQQLQTPVESLGAIPGLRLIPYESVNGCGFLLGLRISQAKIGSRKGSAVVAFAPSEFNRGGAFQALTGGTI